MISNLAQSSAGDGVSVGLYIVIAAAILAITGLSAVCWSTRKQLRGRGRPALRRPTNGKMPFDVSTTVANPSVVSHAVDTGEGVAMDKYGQNYDESNPEHL